MKEQYEAPKIEKLEFDYTDVVTASGGNKYNNDPNDQYYKCLSTDYWGC